MSCCEKSSSKFIQINNFLYNIFKDTIIIKTKKKSQQTEKFIGKKNVIYLKLFLISKHQLIVKAV
jgi:hypothetical protein